MALSLERLRRRAWVRGADERADRRASGFDPTPPRVVEEDLDLSMVRELEPGLSAPRASTSSGPDVDEVL